MHVNPPRPAATKLFPAKTPQTLHSITIIPYVSRGQNEAQKQPHQRIGGVYNRHTIDTLTPQ
jgi:hypothetical protein